jgi:hypothetical protein
LKLNNLNKRRETETTPALKTGGGGGWGRGEGHSIWRGVSKGVVDGRKAVSGVNRSQGAKVMAHGSLGETLGSPWPPLPIGLW